MAYTPTLLQRVAGCISTTLEFTVKVEFQTLVVDETPKARVFAFILDKQPQAIAVFELPDGKVLVKQNNTEPSKFSSAFTSAMENDLMWSVCKACNITFEDSDIVGAVEDCINASLVEINNDYTAVDELTGLESNYTFNGDKTLKVTYKPNVGVLLEGSPDFESRMYVVFDADDYKNLFLEVQAHATKKRKAEEELPDLPEAKRAA
jgi:hypothetical protein